MNARQLRVWNSLKMCLASLHNLRSKSPAIAHNVNELQDACDELNAHCSGQAVAHMLLGVHAKSLTLTRRNLRQKHLLPIVTRGKVLLAGLPGIREELRLPRVRASDAEWVAAARRVAKAVRPHKRAFLDAHFAPDFLQRLEAAAKELQAKSRSDNAQRTRRSVETRAVAESLRHCRDLVASIDSLVMASDDIDAGWLEAWRGAKRIPKRIGRPPVKRKRGPRLVVS